MLLFFGLGGGTLVVAQDTPLYEENTLYVKFKDKSTISAKKLLQSKNGETTVPTSLLGLSANLVNRFKIEPEAISMSLFDNPVLDKTFLISTDPKAKSDIEQLMKELEKDPDIEYVERVPFNRIFGMDAPKSPVNDPFFGKIGEKNINVSWHLDLINAEKAWELQKGDSKIIVAVVDNAIWGEHEDLQVPTEMQYNCVTRRRGNSAPPVSESIQNAVCELPDIYKGTCTAYEFSHGTHCAGAIAAINNNGTGIASIGGGVSLLAIGGPDERNPKGVFNSYHGVTYAVQNGAKIISCSWGSDANSITNEAVMKECYDKGVIVIAAAGNDNVNPPHYPAAYTPYVISVGSVDANRQKSSFSNHGYWVDVLSPGGEDTASYKTLVFSTTFCQNQYSRLLGETNDFEGKYYDEMSGTSMATPVLAGVVGLMLSKDTTLTTDQVREILQRTGQDIVYHRQGSKVFNDYCKIVDAYAALNLLTESPQFGTKIPVTNVTAKTEHDSVWLEWIVPETAAPIKGYNIYRNGASIAVDIQSGVSYDTIFDEEGNMTVTSTNIAYCLDTNLSPGTVRYAIEPIYENSLSVKTEIDVQVKTYYDIIVLIRPSEDCGTIEGDGQYEARQIYTVKAIPAENYEFDYWLNDKSQKLYGATMSGPVSSNMTFFAFFKPTSSNEALKQVESSLRISPNPASDEITVRCPDFEIQHIRITDLQGKTVYDADCRTNTQTINIQSWAKGTYMVQVATQGGTVSQKLIKR